MKRPRLHVHAALRVLLGRPSPPIRVVIDPVQIAAKDAEFLARLTNQTLRELRGDKS